MSVTNCLNQRNVVFPDIITYWECGHRLKHVLSCIVGRRYSLVTLETCLDDGDATDGTEPLELEYGWSGVVGNVNEQFGRYGVELGLDEFSPSGKRVRDLRVYIWDEEMEDQYKEDT